MRNSKAAQALIAPGASESGAGSIAGHAYKYRHSSNSNKDTRTHTAASAIKI